MNEKVVFISFCVILLLILTPICIWHYQQLKQISHFREIQQRNILTIQLCLIFSIFGFISQLSDLYLLLYRINNNNNMSYNWSIYLLYIIGSFIPFFIEGLPYLILYKYYKIFYHVNLTISQLNARWIAKLNADWQSKNFWLRNSSTYGNDKWYKKIFIIFYLISSIISFLLHLFKYITNDTNILIFFFSELFDLITISIPIVLNLFIYKKFPQFYDNLFIKDEMKFSCLIFLIWLLFDIIFTIMILISFFMLNNENNENMKISYYIKIFYVFITSIIMTLLLLISTKFIINRILKQYNNNWENVLKMAIKYKKDIKLETIETIQNESLPIPYTNNSNNNNNSNHESDSKEYKKHNNKNISLPEITHLSTLHLHKSKITNTIKFAQILSKDESFQLFMQYLYKELGANGIGPLLAFVELLQFKILLCKTFTNKINKKTFNENMELAPSIPKSMIIYNSGPSTIKKKSLNQLTYDEQIVECKLRLIILTEKF